MQRTDGRDAVDRRVELAIDLLMDKLASPASASESASLTASSSPPSPPSYRSTFLPQSPPPSPPSPAPSLSLLGKLALSNYLAPQSSLSGPTLSPHQLDEHLPAPQRQLFSAVSPPPVPLLFSRPSVTPISLLSPPPRSSHSHRSPPRLPDSSPPLEPQLIVNDSYSPSTHRLHTYDTMTAPSIFASAHAAYVGRAADWRREGESEQEDEWRISSDADVRRVLDELRDELHTVARKLTAIKRYTAHRTAAAQHRTADYEHTATATDAEYEQEYESGGSPPLSPRTRHIVQLLEEADELLQHNRPAQPTYRTRDADSDAHQQKGELRWADAARHRPKTAPSRSFAGSTIASSTAGSVHSAASTPLLRTFDELLDCFRSQVLRIDATLAAVD